MMKFGVLDMVWILNTICLDNIGDLGIGCTYNITVLIHASITSTGQIPQGDTHKKNGGKMKSPHNPTARMAPAVPAFML